MHAPEPVNDLLGPRLRRAKPGGWEPGQARSTGVWLQAPRSEPPLEQHDDVSDTDLLSHLLALHEAGLITDTELAAKRAALEDS